MNWKRIVTLVIGWTLVAFGVVGLFVPILQGVLFLFVGLLILSKESETAHRLAMKLRERYPKVDEKLHRLRERFHFARKVEHPRGAEAPADAPSAEACGGDGCGEEEGSRPEAREGGSRP